MSITNYPDADFTPNIPNSIANTGKQSYNPTGSFRFWAQKVLPTVYDDSLSYYEILTKVVNYLNAVIQNVDSLNESVDNTNSAFDDLQAYVNTSKNTLIMAYNKLQSYVNTYFDSLDVQEEINAKLDDMASDGSLSNVVSPFIPSLVADWLSDNITPTSPAIDASLSISGAGADAKVAGELIRANTAELTDICVGADGTQYETAGEAVRTQISDLKEDLKHTNNDVYSITQSKVIPLKPNSYIDLSGSSVQMTDGVPAETGYSQTFSYGLFPCSEGDVFTINGVGGGSTRLWGFVDSDGNILSVSSRSAEAKGYSVVAPQNASWIIVHTNDDSVSFYGEPAIYKVAELGESVETQINDLKEDLKHTNNDIYSITQTKVIPLKPNGYIDLSGSSVQMTDGVPVETGYSETFSYGLFPCTEGDVFTINGVGGGSTRLWGFVDSDGNILSVSSRNAEAKGYSIVAPQNASWIIVHTNDDSVSFYGEPLIYKVNALLPNNSIDNASYIHVVDAENLEINLTLENGNKTIYVTGNNLCDNQAKNVAIAAPNIVTGSDYSGLIVPIKGGEIYTVSRTAMVTNRFRAALTVDYPANGVSIVGSVITADNSLSFVLDTTSHPEAKYVVIYLSNSGESISTADYQVEFGYIKTNYEPYNAQVMVTDETSVTVIPRIRNVNIWCDTGKVSAKYYRKAEQYEAQTFSPINTGNISIVCAKEHRYTDGTQAVVEGYLVEECGTKKFFFTKDFANYKYMFTAHIETYKYSFGMLANGDVIACKMAEMLSSAEKTDDNRESPYCWLASENWSIEHEIDFGLGLKPCGWLENCGFKVISNGHALFGEYTRANMATANVWEIIGDPSSRWNWKVRKSFDVTSVDNITGFKHIHMVEQDCYTGIVYVSTGDDNDNSMIWYSTNSGVTWTQLGTPNEKYCRNLSITFTASYVYWAPDAIVPSYRYLFRATRDSSGLIDLSSVVDYIALNSDSTKGIASYGAAYIPEYNCMLVLDRCDGDATEMELDVVDLSNGIRHNVATIVSATGSAIHIGFRTRYTEFNPKYGVIHLGFGFQDVNVVNHNKGFGNMGYDNTGEGTYNINNIIISILKTTDGFNASFGTIY